jgi:hypothetical protein
VPPLHAFLLFPQRHGRDHIHSDVRGHGLQIAFARHGGHLLFTPCASSPRSAVTCVAHAKCLCIIVLCHRRNAKLSKVIFFSRNKENLLILDRAWLRFDAFEMCVSSTSSIHRTVFLFCLSLEHKNKKPKNKLRSFSPFFIILLHVSIKYPKTVINFSCKPTHAKRLWGRGDVEVAKL